MGTLGSHHSARSTPRRTSALTSRPGRRSFRRQHSLPIAIRQAGRACVQTTSRCVPSPAARASEYELAVAEAKGVADQLLGKPACPSAWYKQARNVALTVNGEKVEVLRHLVVATRVNPNAMKASTRRLQIRAWNRRRQPSPETQLPLGAYVDIASAHRFGIFRALRLRENVLALALSVQLRAETRAPESVMQLADHRLAARPRPSAARRPLA
jgi:hypothetical protein